MVKYRFVFLTQIPLWVGRFQGCRFPCDAAIQPRGGDTASSTHGSQVAMTGRERMEDSPPLLCAPPGSNTRHFHLPLARPSPQKIVQLLQQLSMSPNSKKTPLVCPTCVKSRSCWSDYQCPVIFMTHSQWINSLWHITTASDMLQRKMTQHTEHGI